MPRTGSKAISPDQLSDWQAMSVHPSPRDAAGRATADPFGATQVVEWSSHSRGRSSRREGSDADPPLLRAARVRHLAPVMNQQDHHPCQLPWVPSSPVPCSNCHRHRPDPTPDPGFTLSTCHPLELLMCDELSSCLASTHHTCSISGRHACGGSEAGAAGERASSPRSVGRKLSSAFLLPAAALHWLLHWIG